MILEVKIKDEEANFSLGLCVSDDKSEETVITYKRNEVTVDLQKAGQGLTGVSRAPVTLINHKLHLHIFVDRSSIELFINHGEKVITNRIYPKSSSTGAYVKLNKQSIDVDSLRVWELKNIWE
nr:GH32 C-terminal domain-containing protein [Bacillus suaedaesalsae]